MSRPPDYKFDLSERLHEVMDDIGVNEKLVMKRRRTCMMKEFIRALSILPITNAKSYYFGSQIEGSTTIGLQSDVDILFNLNTVNVIQCMCEWEHGYLNNLMMIQNENISPGYCYIQSIRPDVPLPTSITDIADMNKHCISNKRLLLKNSHILPDVLSDCPTLVERHGPALTKLEGQGFGAVDTVHSYYCKSSPHQAISWLQKLREGTWPTEDVISYCRNAGCFVVPVASKVHAPGTLESELEWRISTSLQERELMFSLNIPQLMCYILMKMILKTYINPYVEDVLTSFMCKNLLFYSLANSSHDWHTGNLLSHLHLCLFMLKECIKQRNCPHFIIPENNLLLGCMTDIQRDKLLTIIDNLLESEEQLLFEIDIDNIGRRLKIKLNMIPDCPNIQSAMAISEKISGDLIFELAQIQNGYLHFLQFAINHYNIISLNMAQRFLMATLSFLEIHREEGNIGEKQVIEPLITLVSSTLGSVLACTNMDIHRPVSDQAWAYVDILNEETLMYLEAGKKSDALSGRLKLVSVLYCTGDMERAEHELSIIQTRHNISEIQTACICLESAVYNIKRDFMKACEHYNEEAIQSNIALCSTFMKCEINCVPHELRYELLRSYSVDRQLRTGGEPMWMDFIVVDSVPYLYFLQYKTYGHLQRREEQEQALVNLAKSIVNEPGLGHTETALNLLGQCMEQENAHITALKCYMNSLRHRMRNNAARFLLCILLFKQWKKYNTQ